MTGVSQAQVRPGVALPGVSPTGVSPGLGSARQEGLAAPSREEINPQTQARPQSQRQEDLFSVPPRLDCPLAASTVAFTLTGVDISGATVAADALKPAFESRLGQTIPVSVLCEIRDEVALRLFRSGLLARVEIPPQTIAGGRLKLEVIEARIVSVRVHGDIGPAQDKVESYLNRLRGLTPFSLDTAQRYLLLANDVPGVHVTAALRPSGEGRGAIDLDVQVARDPVQLVAAIQNTGSQSLGPWTIIGRADLNSFTSFGERTSLIAYHTLTNNEQWVVQGVEEARLGNRGLLGRISVAYGESRPGDILAPLGLKGDSIVGTVELDYPLIRLRRENLSVGAGLDIIDQKTAFPGGSLLTDDKLRVIWVKAEASAVQRLADYLSFTERGELDLRQGLSGLGASRLGDASLSRVEGRPTAWTARFDGQFDALLPYFDLGAHLEAQYADRPLLAYEELAIGELTIGRGYEPAALSGDRVVAAEIKPQAGPFKIGFGGHVAFAPFLFYDVAHVENLDTGSETRTVRSEGVGVDVRLPWGVRASLSWADPLDKPFSTSPRKPSPYVLFQLVVIH